MTTSDKTPLRVAITGATGFLGSSLSRHLRSAGHAVVPITRSTGKAGQDAIVWDPARGELDPTALAGIDAVVHLAGENIAQRWSDHVKREIRDSRVKSTKLIARAIAAMDRPPRVWLSGSAIGIYGNRGNELLDESSAPGSGFLADVVQAWEGATDAVHRGDVRVVHLRTGMVLDSEGGALQKMLPPFRLGLGGRIGSGAQMMSWIELGDWMRSVEKLLHASLVKGPVNLVAPTPVSNMEFTGTLGRVLGRPAAIAVPEIAIKLALGEMGEEVLLSSQRAVPTRLLGAGYTFKYETIEPALRAVLAA
jgi:uncharacterized protein (TIGR01777 family)